MADTLTQEQEQFLVGHNARLWEGHVLRVNEDSQTVTVVPWGLSAPVASIPLGDDHEAAYAAAIEAVQERNAAAAARAAAAQAEQERRTADIDKMLAAASKKKPAAATTEPAADEGSA